MPFDLQKFKTAAWQPREIEVVLMSDSVRMFFEEGEKAVFKVRGMSGPELYNCNERAEKRINIKDIIDGLLSKAGSKNSQSVNKLLGIDPNQITDDAARRLEYLMQCLTEPEIKQPDELRTFAIMLFQNCPLDFKNLTDKIIEMTGNGYDPGKVKPSGKK